MLNIVEAKKVRIIFVFSRYKKEHKICYPFPKDKQKKKLTLSNNQKN